MVKPKLEMTWPTKDRYAANAWRTPDDQRTISVRCQPAAFGSSVMKTVSLVSDLLLFHDISCQKLPKCQDWSTMLSTWREHSAMQPPNDPSGMQTAIDWNLMQVGKASVRSSPCIFRSDNTCIILKSAQTASRSTSVMQQLTSSYPWCVRSCGQRMDWKPQTPVYTSHRPCRAMQ
jgi:hypothetical protein